MPENTTPKVTPNTVAPEITPASEPAVATPEVTVAPEVAPTPNIADVTAEIHAKAAATPEAVDYAKFAAMAETPTVSERRTFDFLSVSGGVQTETLEDGVTERRNPATAYKILLTKPQKADKTFESVNLELPLTLIPIKYRVVMEQRAGAQGEILVLKSSEFNGKQSDKVIVSRFDVTGKVTEKYGPMLVSEARAMFKNAEGKGVLRDKAHVYAMHNGEINRFVVKGAGLWEDRSKLVTGKTDASKKPYQYLAEYFSTFPMTEPYFLYEMKVDAAYRDHMAVKFYRPTFERGARISADVEANVLAALTDLHEYFTNQDAEVAKFVATTTAPTTVVVEDDGATDKPF